MDYAIINNNFALDAGLNPVTDSLLIEDADSPYVNVVSVKAGSEDTDAAKALLLKKLRGLPAHVNLIPLNNVEESPLKPSDRAVVLRFQKQLEDQGVPCTIRRTLGSDIDASCGQLRRKYQKTT